MTQPQLVELPESKVIVDPSSIVFIIHAEINKYVLVLKGSPQGPIITGSDVEALIEHMAGVGGLVRLKKKEEPKVLATA